MRPTLATLPFLALAALAAPARAAFLLNQVGSTPAHFDGATASTSQQFEQPYSRYTTGVVDDFAAPAADLHVSNVSAALLGFNGMSSFSAISAYRVEIYSSASAATTSLYGDVAHAYVLPSDVFLTEGYDASPTSALVSIPVSLDLGSSGTYFLSVIPVMDFAGHGQVGVYTSGGFGGGDNAFSSNPGGGYGYDATSGALHGDAAYSVSTSSAPANAPAVPEPAAMALPAITATSLLMRRSRRRS